MCDLHSFLLLSVSLGLADYIPGLKGNLCSFLDGISNGSDLDILILWQGRDAEEQDFH